MARDIASAAPAPSTVSATELGYLDGVTSAIQTQLDAKTAKSTLTTTGDIYYASSANTPARLGIGSTDQVLKVSGGVPAWATPASSGSMTLLSTTTLSGTTTTISSIDQTYKQLVVYILNLYPNGFTSDVLFGLNGTAFSGRKGLINYALSSGSAGQTQLNHTYLTRASGNLQQLQNVNNWYVTIPNYASTTTQKMFEFFGNYNLPTAVVTANGVGYSDSTGCNVWQNVGGNLAHPSMQKKCLNLPACNH